MLKNSSKDILGINKRNLHYIAKYNPRHLYPLVDDKLKTKVLASKYDIKVPKLIETFKSPYQIQNLDCVLAKYNKFVIKPAKGSGGKGILVIKGKKGNKFIKASGDTISISTIKTHILNILSGLFSLAGQIDIAFCEEIIEFDDLFSGICYKGLPDIRIIVFQGYPVMAMMRCPTKASDAKANLHQGAIGIGIDITNGTSKNAVCFNSQIDYHPDTQTSLKNIKIPYWEDILNLACGCHAMTNLGYIGVDIVLDQTKGPLLLEMNARPGLAIQIANNQGLLPILRHIESIQSKKITDKVGYIQNIIKNLR